MTRSRDAFAACCADRRLKTGRRDRLDYMSGGAIAEGLPRDRVALVAEAESRLCRRGTTRCRRFRTTGSACGWTTSGSSIAGRRTNRRVDRCRSPAASTRFKVEYYELGGFAELRFEILRQDGKVIELADRPADLDRAGDADVPGDRPRRRQHHFHLDPVREAAGGRSRRRRGASGCCWRWARASCCCSRWPGSIQPDGSRSSRSCGPGHFRPGPDPDPRRAVPAGQEHPRDPRQARRGRRPRVQARSRRRSRQCHRPDRAARHRVFARLGHHRGRHGRPRLGHDRRGGDLGRAS